MPQFSYTALNRAGEEVKGSVEASDHRAAVASLRGRALFVLKVDGGMVSADATGKPQASLISRLRPIFSQDYVFFLQQMALMLRTGLTVLQALEVCQEQTSKARFAAALERMRSSIQAGKSLSQALAMEKRHFSRLLVKLVESAEASGELDIVLDRAAEDLERRLEVRRKLITSLAYPLVVILSSVGVSAFLVWKVIPKFAAFFARRQVALPWTTQFLVDLSHWFADYGLYFLAAVGVAVAGFIIAYATRAGRAAFDRAFLMVPVFGNVLTSAAMAQSCQTLFVLLNSGVTLLDSLRIAAQVIGNRAIASRFEESAELILKGNDLAGSLKHPVIPAMVSHAVAVGERTGALPPVLEKLSEFYDKDLQARIRRMSSLVEPAMILIVGGMVGFVYMAFFQAVFQLATAGR
ncbi:MAG: type II secretion system F family protein [Gemmataceae bacterium]